MYIFGRHGAGLSITRGFIILSREHTSKFQIDYFNVDRSTFDPRLHTKHRMREVVFNYMEEVVRKTIELIRKETFCTQFIWHAMHIFSTLALSPSVFRDTLDAILCTA